MLGRSQTLQAITDIGESHTTHGSQAFLTRDSVRTMMGEVPGSMVGLSGAMVMTALLPLGAFCWKPSSSTVPRTATTRQPGGAPVSVAPAATG